MRRSTRSVTLQHRYGGQFKPTQGSVSHHKIMVEPAQAVRVGPLRAFTAKGALEEMPTRLSLPLASPSAAQLTRSHYPVGFCAIWGRHVR
jgi:hypothetical protein